MADIDSPRDNELSNHDVQETADSETSLMVVAEEMLADARSEVLCKQSFNMPIAQLATLGAGVSSLLPQLRTVTQTTSFNTSGLFRLANATVGDTLKIAKDGNYWGAFKTAKGSSKLAKLQSAGPISASRQTVMPINPATVMMAIALSSIEKELGKISEMEQQILSFLAIEKESEIEADVETLTNLISNYKLNWDNELFVTSNHTLFLIGFFSILRSSLSYSVVWDTNTGLPWDTLPWEKSVCYLGMEFVCRMCVLQDYILIVCVARHI